MREVSELYILDTKRQSQAIFLKHGIEEVLAKRTKVSISISYESLSLVFVGIFRLGHQSPAQRRLFVLNAGEEWHPVEIRVGGAREPDPLHFRS